MSSEQTRRAVRRTGRIVDADGNTVESYQIIDRACAMFGDDDVMRAMTLIGEAAGSELGLNYMIDAAIRSIIEDIELELSL